MTTQAVVRKVALATSVLEPKVVERLLASLEPGLADRVTAEIAFVRQHGWNRPELVAAALAEQADLVAKDRVVDAAHLYPLALQMDSISYARVLAAQEVNQRDFQLSLLDPGYADEVRQQLDVVPELPERLRAATLAAVTALGATDPVRKR